MDWEAVSAELAKPLNKAHVKPPAPGKYGDYIEGWRAIDEANRIFGFDGWSYVVRRLEQTNASQTGDTHHVGYLCSVQVIIPHGDESVPDIIREDYGHGQGHSKSLGDAHDSAIKESVTDALKRSLRTFGNPFGLALYDKTQANVVDPQEVAIREKSATEYTTDVVARLQTSSELDAAVILQAEQSKIARIRTGYPELFKRIEVAAKQAGAEMKAVA